MGSLFWFSCSRSLCTTEACRYRTHSNPRNHLKRCPTERYNTKNPIKSFLIFKKHTFTLKGIARYKSMTKCNINSTSIKTLYKSIAKCRVLLKFVKKLRLQFTVRYNLFSICSKCFLYCTQNPASK